MNKMILFLLAVCAFTGCSSQETARSTKTEPLQNENKPANANANADTNKNVTAPQSMTGEKIEKVVEEKFSANQLPENWKFIDTGKDTPSEFKTGDSGFVLNIPGGKDFYAEDKTAPHLIKPITGDFEIETKVKFAPKEGYQGAGILIFNNDKNYLRLERGFAGIDGGESGVRFDKSVNGEYETLSGTSKNPTEAETVELKIRRKGKEFTAFWREAGQTEWKEIGKFTSDYPETIQAGLIGVSTTGEITAEFEYVRLSPVKE